MQLGEECSNEHDEIYALNLSNSFPGKWTERSMRSVLFQRGTAYDLKDRFGERNASKIQSDLTISPAAEILYCILHDPRFRALLGAMTDRHAEARSGRS